MSSYLGSHGGGYSASAEITDVSVQLMPNEQFDNSDHRPPRKYLLIVADKANPGQVYLKLGRTGPAVAGQGISIPPGAGYEINFVNLYQGPVFAVSDTGETNKVYIQAGY